MDITVDLTVHIDVNLGRSTVGDCIINGPEFDSTVRESANKGLKISLDLNLS